MRVIFHIRKGFLRTAVVAGTLSLLIAAFIVADSVIIRAPSLYSSADGEGGESGKKFIKWVDFGVSAAAMKQAMKYDADSQTEKIKISWIDLLSAAACKNGGNFSDSKNADIDETARRLKNGETIEQITGGGKYFEYYRQAYSAVLGGMLGKVRREVYDESAPNKKSVKEYYGLKAFSPIAYGFGYSHSDDFGNSRSYGFNRTHKGNDLMGTVGTPVIAVEDGIIESMGWNRYGGWRIGLRSMDFKRYYYYAHLRRGHPYVNTLREGMEVKAGDVIGYLGMTGYSDEEDYNGMRVPHLHFGIQLIFDESQKDGNGEIWIDAYEIVNFLASNKSAVVKDEQSGDWVRKYRSAE